MFANTADAALKLAREVLHRLGFACLALSVTSADYRPILSTLFLMDLALFGVVENY